MSNKVKRKVTVENSKEGDEQPRRPSVFERLGPNAVNVATQPSDRHSRPEQNEKCRNWFRTGTCAYGSTCRYKHDPFPQTSRRTPKQEKEMEEKDLRHKVRTKRDEPKGSRTGSLSPKRVGKRSNSRSRKGEHESKIKSTVVVTRPRSPTSSVAEPTEPKKKGDGNWEDDSDDWPMDAAQLDFKEELTLERKRQQLQRELALELQKERLLNENVTITKTVSFSESSSSSSSSDSGSISSSSGSSSSSSDEDSDDSSSSSSSSSSSGSRPPTKHRNKKSSKDAAHSKSNDAKSKNDYDVKLSKSKPHTARSPSLKGKIGKKGRDKRKESPQSPRRRQGDSKNAGDGRSNLNVRIRGPRTPSPVSPRKQRQWAQSSSTDSRSADVQRNKGKRHKKKRDGSRGDKFKSERGPSPPPLSSPNRTALMPLVSSKKSKRDESSKSRRRGRDSPPSLLPPRNAGTSQPSSKLAGNSQRYLPEEKIDSRQRSDDRSKFYSRKEDENLLSVHKRTDSRERMGKRSRISPRKDSYKGSLSPQKDRYDMEIIPSSKKLYAPISHKDDKVDHRQVSSSPLRADRRKTLGDSDKKRDLSPRGIDSRRDSQFRVSDGHYDKRNEKGKRALSPELKKGRDDRARDYEAVGWSADHRKSTSSTGRRTPEPRGRQDIRTALPISQTDRPRDTDRKKRKDRDHSARSEESERNRLPSPRRSQSPILPHHAVREIEPLTGNRGRIFDTDVPPSERDYPYSYDSLHDPYDRLLPSDYESDVIRSSSIYPEVYPESRYRRDAKDPIDRYGQREVLSPREVLPHRDVISLTARSEEYLSDLPIEDRPYEDRWPRGRNRDDWDAYNTLPSAPIPPHVAAALDEDRYGMPRRRRASPDWLRGRLDDRDNVGGHGRQLGRGQLPSDARSRSPAKGTSSRGSWADRSTRHDRSDNRHDEASKGGSEDRKGKGNRKDRVKRKDEPVEVKKEKSGKRAHSPSPPKENKRRREDTNTPDTITSEKSSYKRSKDEGKGESKSAIARTQKSSKLDTSSPRSDISHSSFIPSDKVESSKVSESRFKDDRRSRNDNTKRDDEFSDWSDGDDDLLNRDDLIDSEETSENGTVRHKSGEKAEETASKRKEKPLKDPQGKKVKDSNSRTNSRDRNLALLGKCFSNFTQKRNSGNSKSKNGNKKSEATNSSTGTSKIPEEPTKDKPLTDSKDSDVPENPSFKDDTATDVDEYITAESVDYDPISDDELDALIEEPEDSILKPSDETEKSKIVDALDVDWSALMSETKTDFKPGCARKRFTAAHVLSRIGFSQVFAGPELSEKLVMHCQTQLDEEKDDKNDKEAGNEEKKFAMEHQIAAFHVSVADMKKERVNIFNKVGPFRRALCARRDLQIRNFLCKPANKFAPTAAVSYSPQYSIVDKDLYKQSLELLRQKVF